MENKFDNNNLYRTPIVLKLFTLQRSDKMNFNVTDEVYHSRIVILN